MPEAQEEPDIDDVELEIIAVSQRIEALTQEIEARLESKRRWTPGERSTHGAQIDERAGLRRTLVWLFEVRDDMLSDDDDE